METHEFRFPATGTVERPAHVGVVGSGDLEVLMAPAGGQEATVVVRTSVEGYGTIWKAVMERFLARHDVAAAIEINDFGATPGVVALRLAQALEISRS